jgi:hypothetical protein
MAEFADVKRIMIFAEMIDAFIYMTISFYSVDRSDLAISLVCVHLYGVYVVNMCQFLSSIWPWGVLQSM